MVEYEGEITSMSAALVEKEPLLSDDGTLPVLTGGSERPTIKLGEPEATNLQGHKKIAKIELRPKSNDDLDEWKDELESEDGENKTSQLCIHVSAESPEEVIYRGKDNSNVFLAEEGEWFELQKKMPTIVLDPGHGYSSGSVGSSARKYHHKIRGENGEPLKDQNGAFVIAKSVPLEKLPQYVLDDIEKWITGHRGDSPGKAERVLVYDVAHSMYNEMIQLGYSEDNLTIFRDGPKYRNANIGRTLKERIKFANDAEADYYISIHADGDASYSTSGAHAIYASSNNSSHSKKLGEAILKYYSIIPSLPESPKKDKRNLGVFKSNHKTKRVTLVELGFVTNPKEAIMMFNNNVKMGKQLAKGLDEHIKESF